MMKRFLHRVSAVSLAMCAAFWSTASPAGPQPPACDAAGQLHGTRVQWRTPPEAAAKQAAREAKLVMLLHLSGNFAKTEFT